MRKRRETEGGRRKKGRERGGGEERRGRLIVGRVNWRGEEEREELRERKREREELSRSIKVID